MLVSSESYHWVSSISSLTHCLPCLFPSSMLVSSESYHWVSSISSLTQGLLVCFPVHAGGFRILPLGFIYFFIDTLSALFISQSMLEGSESYHWVSSVSSLSLVDKKYPFFDWIISTRQQKS
uniref:Uncharacterized protein n=1 Tax=Cacopsylla melanoneura TaxID=428564 RepID=A0A8D8YV04_9HEMI